MENQNKPDKVGASYIHQETHDLPQVTINNMHILVETEVKHLGLYFDQKLTWQKHVKTRS
jgi:hypothetical protein